MKRLLKKKDLDTIICHSEGVLITLGLLEYIKVKNVFAYGYYPVKTSFDKIFSIRIASNISLIFLLLD